MRQKKKIVGDYSPINSATTSTARTMKEEDEEKSLSKTLKRNHSLSLSLYISPFRVPCSGTELESLL